MSHGLAGRVAIGVTGLVAGVAVLAGGAAAGVGGLFGMGGAGSRGPALTAIPTDYLTLYQAAAATCPGLRWTVLAAIGTVESGNGTSTAAGVHTGANPAGAEGPMQFEPATFAAYAYPVPPGGVDPPSPYDPVDAIFAAARDLCANGAANGRDLPGAVFNYNHDHHYVSQVLSLAQRYEQAGMEPSVQRAVAFAFQQLGVPYRWGAEGPGAFDCSGLTQAAYDAAGINLPRTAQQQYNAGPDLPPGTPLLPGDLVYFGTSTSAITHVGIVIDLKGHMVDAPHTGATVRIDAIGAGIVGASRPAS